MKSKILAFRDRFEILMEIRLSGAAKRLIWEMSGKDVDIKDTTLSEIIQTL